MATIRVNLIESTDTLADKVFEVSNKEMSKEQISYVIDTLRNIPEFDINNLDVVATYDPFSGTIHVTYDYMVKYNLYINAMMLYCNGGRISTKDYEEIYDKLLSEGRFRRFSRHNTKKFFKNTFSKLCVLSYTKLATYEHLKDDEGQDYTEYHAAQLLYDWIEGRVKIPLMYAMRDREIVEVSDKYLISIDDVIYNRYKHCGVKDDDSSYIKAASDSDKIGVHRVHLNDRIYEETKEYFLALILVKTLRVAINNNFTVKYDTIAEFIASSVTQPYKNPDAVIYSLMSTYKVRFIKCGESYRVVADSSGNVIMKDKELDGWKNASEVSKWSSKLLIADIINEKVEFSYNKTPNSYYIITDRNKAIKQIKSIEI